MRAPPVCVKPRFHKIAFQASHGLPWASNVDANRAKVSKKRRVRRRPSPDRLMTTPVRALQERQGVAQNS